MLSTRRFPAWTASILALALLTGCRPKIASLDAAPRHLSFYGTELAKEVTVRALDSRGKPIEEVPPLSWTAADAKIVEVSSTGHLVPKSPGKTTVTVRSGELSTTISVEVVDLSKIELSPALLRLVGPKGTTSRLELTGKNAAHAAVAVPTVSWILTDRKVASVAADGTVTSLASGKTLVTAKVGELVAESELEVDIQNVSRIELRPETAILRVGESQKLAVTAYDDQGAPIPEAGAQLSTDAPDVVRVQGDGTVTGLKPGTALVTAVIGERRAQATILVQ